MRTIDADALITEIEEYRIKFPHGAEENTQNMMIELFCNYINNAPTVDIGYIPYREETCEYKSHCNSYEHWYCIGCVGCKKGDAG